MMHNTLISTTELSLHLEDPEWVILDCRYSLGDAEYGRRNYQAAHIPGAIYAHLSEDLAGKKTPGVTGRHPLPEVEETAKKFSAWGIGPEVQVVTYDDAGGALAAARAWWMLRWLGHTQAAVLDGGWQKWLAEGRATRGGQETWTARRFVATPNPEMLVEVQKVDAIRLDPAWRLLDARATERYHGKNETIDAVAGHIPGALSAPYFEDMHPDLTFRSPDALRMHYQELLGETPAERAVFYCGSGVTSIHNILAMVHAGLGEARLYPGSWSEWICDSKRPVATE